MSLKITCPKGCREETFVCSVAHIREEWLTDNTGEWLETRKLKVVHQPDEKDLWICATCGSQAKAKVIESKSKKSV